ncbi:MAG TPA: YncE family protein, partial [Gammaproteobacteria bacterium]|nr:YncE family protein [Gammaproteobacteria bacterium]
VMSNATAGNVVPDVVGTGLIGDPGNTSDDQDQDGMPDSWEVKYGFNPFEAADAVADANGNGVNNLQEYRNDANPVKSLSTPDRLYLSDHGGGAGDGPRIIAIDPVTDAELASIAMTSDPQGLVAHPDGSTVYAAVGTDLSVIDVQSNAEVNHLTAVTGTYDAVGLLEDLAISTDGRTLYLAYRKMPYSTLEIKAFDTTVPADPAVKRVIDDAAFKGCYGPLGLGVKPDGSKLYVACRPVRPGTADRFYIADAASGAVTRTATFARDRSNLTFINGITVSADGSRVYLARSDSDGSTVEVFDGDTGESAGSIALPDNALPRRSVVSPDGSKLYVVDQRLGTHVIDTATDTILMTMSNTHSRGVDIAVNRDGSRLYLASLFRVFVLDGDANDWSSTITGDFGHVFQLALTPGR